ncbi:MAG: sulfite exporter TauE/SafE family protein [Oscillospiraceae bacterium]|nr:sulfite exporter TauE/SafE family protein [Oscillospiraceae bacterium]
MNDLRTETIPVKGMFCTNCERKVQEALLSLPGVQSTDASFAEETVTVIYDEKQVSFRLLKQEIERLGYETVSDNSRYIQIVSILIILLAMYVIAGHLGWTRVFHIFPNIEASLDLGMLFVIGLLTSVHCIAMCGGINLTQSTMAAKGGAGVVRSNLAYNIGRVISYTVIGGIVGGIGSVVSFSGALKGAVTVAVGIIMIVMALSMLGVFRPLRKLSLHLPAGLYRKLSGSAAGRSSLVIGLLNGLMPCGPLQSMQIYALSTGSIIRGALSMLLFSLGTVPLMLGLGVFSGGLNRKRAGIMLTVSAILVFVMGIHMTENGLALSGISLASGSRNESAVMAEYFGDTQYVKTKVDYGSYEAFTVRKGIPVEWTIEVPEGKLNGCNGEIVVPAFDLSIKLHEGENTVSFTPNDVGTIPYSCWMGMIKSSINVVD